jgi:hypothetical protein
MAHGRGGSWSTGRLRIENGAGCNFRRLRFRCSLHLLATQRSGDSGVAALQYSRQGVQHSSTAALLPSSSHARAWPVCGAWWRVRHGPVRVCACSSPGRDVCGAARGGRAGGQQSQSPQCRSPRVLRPRRRRLSASFARCLRTRRWWRRRSVQKYGRCTGQRSSCVPSSSGTVCCPPARRPSARWPPSCKSLSCGASCRRSPTTRRVTSPSGRPTRWWWNT